MDSAREAAEREYPRHADEIGVPPSTQLKRAAYERGYTAAKAEASAATADAERCSCGLALGHGSPTTEIDVTEDEVEAAFDAYWNTEEDCNGRECRKSMRAALEAALRKRRERG